MGYKILNALFSGAALWCALTCGSPLQISAQETVELNPDQKALLEKGVRASDRGEFDEAIQYYRAALVFGQVNVAYMGLGRALQKKGECKPANAAYDMALKAPMAEEPSVDQVKAAIENFQEALAQTCPGELVVACTPPDMKLSIDSKPRACGESVTLPAGEHVVAGEALGQRVSQKVRVVGLKKTSLDFVIKPGTGTLVVNCANEAMTLTIAGVEAICGKPIVLEVGEVSVKGVLGEEEVERTAVVKADKTTEMTLEITLNDPGGEEGGMSGLLTTSLITTGAGTAALITAIIADQMALSSHKEIERLAGLDVIPPDEADEALSSFNTRRSAAVGLGITGIVLISGGAILYFLDGSDEAGEVGVAPGGVHLRVDDEQVGLSWEGVW